MHLTLAIELDPSMGHAFIFRGISYQDQKNYGKAIEDFTQAINFNPEKSESFSIRGLAYEEAGDFEKAKADFERALELNPNDEVAKEYLEKLSEE
jgi:tetratricopeptide (TPR) repeat protein